MPEQEDARFGEPLFGEAEFGDQPEPTLVQTASRLTKTSASLIQTSQGRRITA